MADKKTGDLLKECDAQIDSLFVHFGKFLYENIETGNLSYYFDPQDKKPAAIAKALIKNVSTPKTPPPAASTRQAKQPKQKKLKIAKAPRSLGIERRGQLEPYTKLIVDLRVFANKLLEIQNDLNDCISAALLHTDSQRSAAYQHAVNEKIGMIVALVGKSEEAIKLIMEKKRKFLEEKPEAASWKAEEGFLKRAAGDVTETTKRIDVLIDEVVGLFEGIKTAYEKDIEAGRLARETKYAAGAAVISRPRLPEEDEGAEETEEIEDTEKSEEAAAEEVIEGDDYGLFETASRRLSSNITDEKDRLGIMHALFRSAPKRSIPFLYDLIKSSNAVLQRQLASLLRTLDYPTIVDLYRRFISDEEPSLRLQGIMGLVKLGSDEAKHAIASAVNDRDPHVRRFVANCLEHTGGEAEAAAIMRLANDADETVSRIAIRKLGRMGDHFAFSNLVPKLEDKDIKIRREAIEALRGITGTDFGYDYTAAEAVRQRQAQKWKMFVDRMSANPHLLRELQARGAADTSKGRMEKPAPERSEKRKAKNVRPKAPAAKTPAGVRRRITGVRKAHKR